MMFINLGKAYARVPRKIFKWTLKSIGFPKMYISVTEDMYDGSY